MYSSNVLRIQDNANLINFQCYSNNLAIPDNEAIRCLRDENISIPHYILNGRIFYNDLEIQKLPIFNKIVGNRSESSNRLTPRDRTWERIVKNLLLRGVSETLIKKGFSIEPVRGGPIYYRNSDPQFQLKINGKNGEAIYKVVRGIRPQIFLDDDKQLATIILEPDSSYNIFISYSEWPKWIGFKVVSDDANVKLRGACLLEDVNEEAQTATITQDGDIFEVSVESLKILPQTDVLRERGIIDDFYSFSSFKGANSGVAQFFNRVNELVLEGGKLTIKLSPSIKDWFYFNPLTFTE